MTATPGTNSYVDETTADTYFSDKFGYELWDTALSANKNASLVSATQVLDNLCDWGFYVEDDELAFGDDPPQRVMDAQCEIAYNIIAQNSVSQEGDDPTTKIKAGSVEIELKAGQKKNPLINDLILSFLSPYGVCPGIGSTKSVPFMRG